MRFWPQNAPQNHRCERPCSVPRRRQLRFIYQNIRSQRGFYPNVSVIFSAFRSDCQCIGDCQLARDFAVTDWLTVIYRYFRGNPDEGSDFISKGFVASAIFILYTRKFNPIFSDFQDRIFDFNIAALDMTNLEWPYIFPRSRINLPLVMPFVFLGDMGETKLIREATLKGHISVSWRGISIVRIGLEPPWAQLNLGRIKRL